MILEFLFKCSDSAEDPEAPGVVEETKYWVTVETTRTDTLDIEFGA